MQSLVHLSRRNYRDDALCIIKGGNQRDYRKLQFSQARSVSIFHDA